MLVEERQVKASRAVLGRLHTRRTPHPHVTDPHLVRARRPLRVLASRSYHDDVRSARTPPGESCAFKGDLDGHPGLVPRRDFNADRVLGRDVRVPSDQEPPHCGVDDEDQLDGLV